VAKPQVYRSGDLYLVTVGTGTAAVGQVVSEATGPVGGPALVGSILAHTPVAETWADVTKDLPTLPQVVQKAARTMTETPPKVDRDGGPAVTWG
jgi:hypothetical protein